MSEQTDVVETAEEVKLLPSGISEEEQATDIVPATVEPEERPLDLGSAHQMIRLATGGKLLGQDKRRLSKALEVFDDPTSDDILLAVNTVLQQEYGRAVDLHPLLECSFEDAVDLILEEYRERGMVGEVFLLEVEKVLKELELLDWTTYNGEVKAEPATIYSRPETSMVAVDQIVNLLRKRRVPLASRRVMGRVVTMRQSASPGKNHAWKLYEAAIRKMKQREDQYDHELSKLQEYLDASESTNHVLSARVESQDRRLRNQSDAIGDLYDNIETLKGERNLRIDVGYGIQMLAKSMAAYGTGINGRAVKFYLDQKNRGVTIPHWMRWFENRYPHLTRIPASPNRSAYLKAKRRMYQAKHWADVWLRDNVPAYTKVTRRVRNTRFAIERTVDEANRLGKEFVGGIVQGLVNVREEAKALFEAKEENIIPLPAHTQPHHTPASILIVGARRPLLNHNLYELEENLSEVLYGVSASLSPDLIRQLISEVVEGIDLVRNFGGMLHILPHITLTADEASDIARLLSYCGIETLVDRPIEYPNFFTIKTFSEYAENPFIAKKQALDDLRDIPVNSPVAVIFDTSGPHHTSTLSHIQIFDIEDELGEEEEIPFDVDEVAAEASPTWMRM